MAADPDTAASRSPDAPSKPDEPYVPVYHLAHHYYLYHAPTIAHLRSTYSLPGTLIGTLPQSSQQNVFLGLPLLLMPEEVSYLCKLGVAYVVDDMIAHQQGIELLKGNGRQERGNWMRTLVEAGAGVARGLERQKGLEREKALRTMGEKEMSKRAKRRAVDEKGGASQTEDPRSFETSQSPNETQNTEASQFLHDEKRKSQTSDPRTPAYTITPTTSHPPLPLPQPSRPSSATSNRFLNTNQTPSTALHSHLTRLSYVLTPGLRFGCQYLAYPGDPLRFHSHFLVVGREWEEEVELLTLVGLGRLGTGVKKGVCFGGVENEVVHDMVGEGAQLEREGSGDSEEEDSNVRCFTIEWGGM